MKLKGLNMLKFFSVLMIISGAASLVYSAIHFGISAYVTSRLGFLGFFIAGVLPMVTYILELIAGAVGIKATEIPNVGKIKIAATLGVAVLVLSVISIAYSVIYYIDLRLDLTNFILDIAAGLLIPGLYVWGVFRFRSGVAGLLMGNK